MDEHYCPGCGREMPGEAAAVEAAVEDLVHADVEIARINADRDIRLAQISARVETSDLATDAAVAEAVAVAAVAEAEAVAEALAPPEPEPAVVVETPEPEPVPEAVSDPVALPEAESHHTARKSQWSWY